MPAKKSFIFFLITWYLHSPIACEEDSPSSPKTECLKYLKFLFVIVYLSLSTSLQAFEYQLSICTMFQNESLYIKDWIDYHRYMGVEHFWLYNDRSTDDYRTVLLPYIEKGVVELIEWPSVVTKDGWHDLTVVNQPEVFTDALNKARGVSKWLAIIDTDEYIFPVQEATIIDCLEARFTNCPGIRVNWQCYGTSHVAKIPEGTHIWDALLYKMPWDNKLNLYTKSIVQPNYVKNCPNPHFCNYLDGYQDVNTHYKHSKNDSQSSIHIDILRINHYWTRDEWFLYHVRLPKRMSYERDTADFLLRRAEEMNEVFDDSLSQRMKFFSECN